VIDTQVHQINTVLITLAISKEMGSLQPNAVVVAVAVAAVVLAALVAGVSCWTNGGPKVPPGPNITADYDGKWLAAKATWYGSPVGSGPVDNGTYVREILNIIRPHAMHDLDPSDETSSCMRSGSLVRRRVRVRGREPAALQRHDVLWQRAHLQGRQGLRLMLSGGWPVSG